MGKKHAYAHMTFHLISAAETMIHGSCRYCVDDISTNSEETPANTLPSITCPIKQHPSFDWHVLRWRSCTAVICADSSMLRQNHEWTNSPKQTLKKAPGGETVTDSTQLHAIPGTPGMYFSRAQQCPANPLQLLRASCLMV